MVNEGKYTVRPMDSVGSKLYHGYGRPLKSVAWYFSSSSLDDSEIIYYFTVLEGSVQQPFRNHRTIEQPFFHLINCNHSYHKTGIIILHPRSLT